MKNYFVMAGISLAVFLVGIVFVRPVQQVVEKVVNVGAISSYDFVSPYFSVGGVRTWGANTTSLTAASTTICSLVSPAATSTLVSASVHLKTSTTTAMQLWMGRGAGATALSNNATTTWLSGPDTIAANAVGLTYAAPATTTANGVANQVFGPSTPLNVTLAGAVVVTNLAPTGACSAKWEQIAY